MRICFFGDSFTNGTGDPTCLGWVGRVCAAAAARGADLTVYNLGIRRDTSAEIAARWRREAEARLPDECDGRLVFCFGANDAAQALDPALTLAMAEAVLTEASRWRPTLMVGPPPVPDSPEAVARLGALSPALASLCRRIAVPCLETFALLSGNDAWTREALENDGAHPRADGYAALARLVAAWPEWRRWVSGA